MSPTSLLSSTFVLLTASGILSQRGIIKLAQETCDRYASCERVDHAHTCYCDRFCRVHADCCPDYVDQPGDSAAYPLLPEFFACLRLSDKQFYVIKECPVNYTVQFVRDACRRVSVNEQPLHNETFYVIPVSSRTSGLVYRNVYCAACHGEDNVAFWQVKTRGCMEPETSETDGPENIDILMRWSSFVGNCSFYYLPPSDVSTPRRCVSKYPNPIIDTCPKGTDAQLASRCTEPSNVAFVYFRGRVYRNRHCAACHGKYNYTCNSSPPFYNRSGRQFESFTIMLDLNIGKGVANNKRSGETWTQRLRSCAERHVYDPFKGTCLVITCPPGHTFTDDGRSLCRRSPVDDEYVQQYSAPFYLLNNTTTITGDVDCTWIKLNASEYRLLLNGSIYVHAHDATYDVYQLDVKNETAYVCMSFQRNFTQWVHEALRVDSVGVYLSLVCSVVSLLALAFQFAIYMAFPVLRNTPGRCIVSLVVSLFVGQSLFLLVKTGSYVSRWFCFGQAALMHFAFMAAFLWMNVVAMDVYRTFSAGPVDVASSSSLSSGARRRFAEYSAYAWTTAAVLVGVGVTLDLADVGTTYRPHYGRHEVCWFGSRGSLLVLFGVPVAVVLVVNIVLFALSVGQIRGAAKASQLAVQKTDQTYLLVCCNHILRMTV